MSETVIQPGTAITATPQLFIVLYGPSGTDKIFSKPFRKEKFANDFAKGLEASNLRGVGIMKCDAPDWTAKA